ncbi:hypothetical protein R5W23_003887 [Gemmata sp. JC673]|uniref:PhnA-like protein n=1 Tax=Gemmata algarum TaxID=2975278 RepID=A0ABU5F9A0_9BACT|nr:hypothetical protein [Gemmata algarum]MDY3562421.1 hypothetical protein [Gemmata algarum]
MADTVVQGTHNRVEQPVGVEDLAGVRSRISWGAILAGSVLAVALYFLLTLLGGAIGFSVSDKFGGRTIGIAAAVYAIVVTAFCLFAGGFVASQLTTGENKREAAMYGLLVWAAVFAMLLWLMASGVKAGFNSMVGVATAGGNVADVAAKNVSQADAEEAARRFGFTQQQIDEVKAKAKSAPADARAAAEDPANRQRAEDAAREAGDVATRVTWYSFLGTLVSMLAAAAGGYAGAGPTFRLFAVPTVRPRLA